MMNKSQLLAINMGSKRSASSSFSFILLIFLLTSSFPTQPFTRALSSNPNPTNGKVSLELCYETLCPDSVDLIVNHLVELFQTGLVSIVDLKLLPYGNARLRSNNTIICQIRQAKFSRFLLLCWFVLFVSFCPFPTWGSKSSEILAWDSRKVSLGLYYESLCPYSANFVVNYLVKLFEDDLISIVDLNLVPWGNAKIRGSNNTVVCQHGPYECLLNTVEACAINIWPELSKHFPFIYCIEALVFDHKYTQWESCFQKLNLDPKRVLDCYTSDYGKELELQYAAETDALQPPHEYVPWVVVDGQPLYEDYENFLSYICAAYNGTVAQMACIKLSLNTMKMERAKPSSAVCYKQEEKMPTSWARIRSAILSWMRQMNLAASE